MIQRHFAEHWLNTLEPAPTLAIQFGNGETAFLPVVSIACMTCLAGLFKHDLRRAEGNHFRHYVLLSLIKVTE